MANDGDDGIPTEAPSGTHLTVGRVSLQAVLEHLTSDSQVSSRFGSDLERARDGTSGAADYVASQSRAEERLLATAAIVRCVDDLGTTTNLSRIGEACSHIRSFAVKTKLREGQAVLGVLRAYLPWATQWPESGLVSVYAWMRARRPSLQAVDAHGEVSVAQAFRTGKAKAQRAAAAILVADSEVVLSAWVEHWNRRGTRRAAPASAA